MAHDDTHGDLSILEARGRDAMPESKRTLADMTIFGMRLCRRRKTDAEYVASIRKVLAISKWMAILHGVLAVLGFAALLFLYHVVFDVILGSPDAEVPVVDGLNPAIGFGIGVFMGLLFMQAMSSLIHVLTFTSGQRTERLMLKFHDALQSGEAHPGPTDLAEQS